MTDHAPKSDIERFIELYHSFGIECVVSHAEDGCQKIRLSAGFDGYNTAALTLSPKFGGYNGFSSEVIFDRGGKFIGQNFWE